MIIEEKIESLQNLVSKYDIKSFAGFFAFFIGKGGHENSEVSINKFKSRLKDFLYLIALNAFTEKRGNKKFEFSDEIIGVLANKVNEIKEHYKPNEFSTYNRESVIHEMAFSNHFDNGVLSYAEQDLERIKKVFSPFEENILKDIGLDLKYIINIINHLALVSVIRLKENTQHLHSKEFIDFIEKVQSNKIDFKKELELLTSDIQNQFLNFHEKSHNYLLFRKEDLYLSFPEKKVNIFLNIFSCKPNPNPNFKYYAQENPFDSSPLLQISSNLFMYINLKQLPIAVYNYLYNHLLISKKTNDKIRRHREKNLEKKVVEIFKNVFPSKSSFFYENYFVLENHEQDLLILYKGTALIIETKASKLREPFRDVKKAIIKLKADFEHSVQYGYNQCLQVEDLFYDNQPFTIKKRNGSVLYKINPTRIHSVFSIVVTLERFGTLQTDLNLFLEKEEDYEFPWSVYIDDLETFLLTLKHQMRSPSDKFLDFLRDRRKLHGHVYAIDELDICATYIESPKKFKKDADMEDYLIQFSPHKQRLFDDLYFSRKLRFKEKIYPDEYYKFGIP